MRYFLLFLLFPLLLSAYQFPRQEVKSHKGLNTGDFTRAIAINGAMGFNIFYWNNDDGVVFNDDLNTLSFGIVMDYYWIFYEGFTWSVFFETGADDSDHITFNRAYGTFGYRLRLYKIVQMKGEGLIASGRSHLVNLGGSFSIGLEFALFKRITIGWYQNIQMMLFNFENKTDITTETRFVIGGYF